MMKNTLITAMIAASATLVGCGSSSSSDSDPVAGNTNVEALVASNPRTLITTATDYCSEFGGTLTASQCALPSRITATDGSFSADLTYTLSGLTFLGYGDKKLEAASDVTYLKQNPVSLTIPAGTTIKGGDRTAFIVTRGAKLMAEGTSAAPVTFESTDGDLVGGGEWGGLVLQGFGVSNQCPDTGLCNIISEGGVGEYGGDDNADSSGSLQYVVVTEGGFEIGTGNEVNGVGFMGVGSGTTVENLQVNENADDGVEFWGGAVVVKNLVLTNNADDSIDWDHGWVGGIQNALVKQVNGEGDHLFETDNDGDAMDAEPRSMPTIANVTAISGGADSAIRHKEGTAAKMYNVAIVEQGTASVCLDVDHQQTADQIDTGMIYTNVALGCATTLKGDDEVSGKDFGQALLDSQVSSIEVAAGLAVDANYVVSGNTAIQTAPTIDNANITGNTTMGAVIDVNNKWFAGWTVAGSL